MKAFFSQDDPVCSPQLVWRWPLSDWHQTDTCIYHLLRHMANTKSLIYHLMCNLASRYIINKNRRDSMEKQPFFFTLLTRTGARSDTRPCDASPHLHTLCFDILFTSSSLPLPLAEKMISFTYHWVYNLWLLQPCRPSWGRGETRHINELGVKGHLAVRGVHLYDHRANEHYCPFAINLIN